jgi:hypothetical protein
MREALLVAVLALVASGAAGAAPPSPGRYEAVLCVATQAGAEPSCGSVDVELRSGGLVVRVADIVYRLVLGRDEMEVATLHGTMQIDEFNAPYEWRGETLRFSDLAKDVRYEVRLGNRLQPR